MKTPYQIAKELNVSPQAVYKKLTPAFLSQHIKNIEVVVQNTKNGEKNSYRLNAAAEEAVKKLFNLAQQQFNEKVEYFLVNQLNSENAYLRQKLDEMTALLRTEQALHADTKKLLMPPSAEPQPEVMPAPIAQPNRLVRAWRVLTKGE